MRGVHWTAWLVRLVVCLSIVSISLPGAAPPALALAPNAPVVISQVYGGGGNTGAVFTHDFIELFNRGTAPVALTGWSVQYASATGTGNFQATPLPAVTLQPGQYFLIQQAAGAGNGAALPTPDASGTLNLSGTAGKVILATAATGLPCNGGSTPCDAAATAAILDLVGYGNANFFEGSAAAPALSNSTAAQRASNGCTDTNANSADLTAGAPTPRNAASPANPCGASNQPVVATCPATLNATPGTAASASISARDADGTVSSATITSPAVAGISLDGFAPADTVGGTASAILNVASTTAAGHYSVTIRFANDDATPQTADCTIAVSVLDPAPSTRIHAIQGAGHISPLFDLASGSGQTVTGVPGIVTVVRSNGFYMQDPEPDADPATAEGLFVFTGSAPGRAAGDRVAVSGPVVEFRPGCTPSCASTSSAFNNLTLTQLGRAGATASVTLVAAGNPLPAPTIIGTGGRIPPQRIIDNDSTGDAETGPTTFDPAQDGLDFYESLEGMLVQVNDAVAVGPTNGFGEIPVLPDNGAHTDPNNRTSRGGIAIASDDFNPERIILDDAIVANPPRLNVNDRFGAPIVGIMDYSFANYKLLQSQPWPSVISGGLSRETLSLPPLTSSQLTLATFNVENLDPGDGTAAFSALATTIVTNLRAPDLIAIEEIQDNNGAQNDSTVDASQTYSTLIAAIQAAGGPLYAFRQIDPVDDQDGGEPGGNIRVGFLFRTDRGLAFVDRPGGTATAAVSVVNSGGPQLSFSPGRIEPSNSAFANSRKPLVGEFTFNGHRLFVIANHFNSKGGDQPLFGRFQPPTLSSEVQRRAQATLVADFVRSILALDARANVVVLGDLNDFQFSAPLAILKAAGLTTLVETLPASERYTYVFDGNSQVLDHIMVSQNLLTGGNVLYDIVHLNSEFVDQTSDHEPGVARLELRAAATLGLTISPTAPSVLQGDQLTLTLDYTTSEPTNLTLTARVPAGTQFVSAASGGTLSGETITWNLGAVPAGSGSVAFTIKTFNAGRLTLNATVSDTGSSVSASGTTEVLRRLVAYRSLAAVANERNNNAVAGSRGGRGTVAILGLLSNGQPLLLSSFDTGRASAEIVQFTPDASTLLVTNSDQRELIVIDVRDPYAPTVLATVAIPNGGEPSSVAIHPDGRLALVSVIDPVNSLNNGTIQVFDIVSRTFLPGALSVGPNPDSIAIAPDGRTALVTNEADDDGAAGGPEGSVSVLRLSAGAPQVITTLISSFNPAGFTRFADYTRVEPEHASITPDSRYGLFTIQNPEQDTALAVIDLRTGAITDIVRYTSLANGGSRAQAEPDGVSSWRWRGRTYAATANEEDQSLSIFEISQGRATLLSTTRVEEFLPVPIDTSPTGSGPNGLGNSTGSPADDPTFPFDNGEPDPEGIAVTVLNGRVVAIITLEESGAALVLDLTDPAAVTSRGLVRNLSADASEVNPTSGSRRTALTGRPEGVAVVSERANLEPIQPILECVTAQGGGRYLARFGYRNDNDAPVVLPVGPRNQFRPQPDDRDQPTLFDPGRQTAIFEVAFDGRPLVWELNGRLAIATFFSPRCRG